jgi:hypothetical protein
MACDAQRPEPDLAMNLEVCDAINQTKKSAYVKLQKTPELFHVHISK